eukprot:312804-Chlamydomonas_euryale.AAC.6
MVAGAVRGGERNLAAAGEMLSGEAMTDSRGAGIDPLASDTHQGGSGELQTSSVWESSSVDGQRVRGLTDR